ncbi:MAG: DNA polymerase III subunit delta' [Magnetococcales bacterium]|nr:DNA polymerase III subunit delta' [Magnetococcales bacterium]MBF0418641.1 DNA polymerase III subunit delta' [Magnetococcales bacterium]
MNEIVGHREIVRGLQAGLQAGNLSHAYLFTGPEGVGKATVARALAQALLCQDTQRVSATVTGCLRCPSCHKVAMRCHPDLIVVEMAEKKTRIAVDQIRELARFLSLTPMESPWKVAIIDDAASMNPAAANALLKTLEEPPAQSILILVTSRPGMLLATIRSRCVIYPFNALSKEDFFRILADKTSLKDTEWDGVWHYSEGNVGFGLNFVAGGQLDECSRLYDELRELMTHGGLARLCDVAEHWSKEERFALARTVVGRWLVERVRESVRSDNGAGGVRAWLAVEAFAREIFARGETFNVNKRYLLEGIFIKMIRTSGASL